MITSANASYVWTLRGGAARRVAVIAGRKDEGGVEVKRGLNDGETVIVAPPANLSDGQKAISRSEDAPS
jgi:hypothetical protein